MYTYAKPHYYFQAKFRNNQKLGLCEALLDLGDWTSAKNLLDRFPENLACSYAPLARALCQLLHYIIEPVYQRYCPLPSCVLQHRCRDFGTRRGVTQAHEPIDLLRQAFPIAAYLGEQLSCDTILCTKLCRIGETYMEQRATRSSRDSASGEPLYEAVYQGFFNLLDGVLLPALDLIESNHPMAESAWGLLRHLPYDHRYRLYSQWKQQVMAPRRVRQRADTLARCKYIMK